jgi:hypothetical protein
MKTTLSQRIGTSGLFIIDYKHQIATLKFIYLKAKAKNEIPCPRVWMSDELCR